MPGAAIRVTNVETGVARRTVAGSRGEYRVSNLPPGSYEVEAEAAGFQTGVRRGITITVGRDAVVNFTLNVGDVTERVTVTGEAPIIETTTATVSSVVDSQQMRDSPLNSRSFLELVPLQTGAVFAEAGSSSATKGFGRKLSISGTRYNANSFLLDGASMNDAAGVAGSAAQTMGGGETVREFKVVTNAYDSEFGRHTGGVISAVTKSGTNEIHGSVFEFLRNDNMDAANFFDNSKGSGKPEFKRNQFGGTVSGPIARDKSFFFGSYEGLREHLGRTQLFDVPGIDTRNGFIGGNNIGVDPEIAPWLAAYPVPNVIQSNGSLDRSDGTGQFATGLTRTTEQDLFLVRSDNTFSDSDSLMGRFSFDDADQFRPGDSGFNTGALAQTRNRFATLEETHIFSPQMIARTHFSFNRTRLDFNDIGLEGAVFPQFSCAAAPDVSCSVDVDSLSNWGGGATNPKRHIQNDYQFKEDLSYFAGRHSLRFGFGFERLQFNQRSDFHAGGDFAFASLRAFLENDVETGEFIKPGSDNIRGWRQSVVGFYIQDDINIKPGFTLNAGVRYEFITVPTEANGKVATIRDLRRWTPTDPFFTVGPDTTDIGDPMFDNPSLANFAPRVGFAWDPFGNGKTSIRGGAGFFHDQILPNAYITSGVRVAPFFSVAELNSEDLVDAGIVGGIDFPNAFTTQRDILTQGGGRPQVDGFQFHVDQPTVYKWSFDIQQEVLPDTTVEAGYTGTRGTHLIRGALQFNPTPAAVQPDGRTLILINEPQPNDNFNRMRWRVTDGASKYHAFRLSVRKRFSGGFQMQSSYTFSKSIDDSSTWTGSTDFGDADRRGYFGEKEIGLSSFDVRNSWTTNFVYDIPTGDLTGTANKILGGWSLSSILRFNSGNPISLTASQPTVGGRSMRWVDGSRLDLVQGGDQSPIDARNPNQYFDPTQFVLPWDPDGNRRTSASELFVGNLGRSHLIVPGVANVDFTFMKDTALGERTTLQFRAEFFNIFNRANFGSPENSLFTGSMRRRSNAGEILDTRTTSRQIQFALRLAF